MTTPLTTHPSTDVLRAFASGQLNDATAEQLVAHLETCSPCRARASCLTGDSFLERLRAAQDRRAASSDTPLPATIDHVPAPPNPRPTKERPPDHLPEELRDHKQFEVLRTLGRGGMGVVYLARNKLMGRREVLKVVHRDLLDHPKAAARFLQEICSAARLNHPNIVTAYSAFQVGELLVLAMEYVEGEDLARTVAARGPLPVANACHYASQAALGLQHALEKGMVHRDIKPHNLILARDGKKHTVKILDFGLAKATQANGAASRQEPRNKLTKLGAMMGTPEYMAPEQIVDAAGADIRADLYGLGCTLYFLLTGRPPFAAPNVDGLLEAHLTAQPRPLHEVRPEVPPDLAAMVARLLAKDPAQRYQEPVEVVQALAPFVQTSIKPPPQRPAPVGDQVPAASANVPPPAATIAGGHTAGERSLAVSRAGVRSPKPGRAAALAELVRAYPAVALGVAGGVLLLALAVTLITLLAGSAGTGDPESPVKVGGTKQKSKKKDGPGTDSGKASQVAGQEYDRFLKDGDAAFTDKKYPEAITAYDRALTAKPGDERATQSREHARTALREEQQRQEALKNLKKRAELAFANGKLGLAVDLYRIYLESAKNDKAAVKALAEAEAALAEDKDQQQQLEKFRARVKDANNALLVNDLLRAVRNLGEARQIFANHPRVDDLDRRIAKMAGEGNKPDHKQTKFNELVELAREATNKRHWIEADGYYRLALALISDEPKATQAWMEFHQQWDLARLQFNGELALGKQALKESMAEEVNTKLTQVAIAHFNKADFACPENEVIQPWLGEANKLLTNQHRFAEFMQRGNELKMANKRADALAAFTEACKIFPRNKEAMAARQAMQPGVPIVGNGMGPNQDLGKPIPTKQTLTVRITEVNAQERWIKYKKSGKSKKDEVTYTTDVAGNCEICKGINPPKMEAGDPIAGGLQNAVFRQPVNARITISTTGDNRQVSQILVVWPKDPPPPPPGKDDNEFLVNITQTNAPLRWIEYRKILKDGKVEDQTTRTPLAADCDILKGAWDKESKKYERGEPLPKGLPNVVFGKGPTVRAQITIGTNGQVTQILVVSSGKKPKGKN